MEPSWHVLGPEPARVGPAPGQYRKTLAYERMQRSLCPLPLKSSCTPAALLRFPACCLTLMRGSQQGNARHTDLFLALARLGNVVGRLHTHQRVHLHSKSFLDTERHIPG